MFKISALTNMRKDPDCMWVLIYELFFNYDTILFSDIEIADKCENYCTKVFVDCLNACNDEDCYAQCHRDDYVCLDSQFSKKASIRPDSIWFLQVSFNHFNVGCPCHTDCISGCDECSNPICNCKVLKYRQLCFDLTLNVWDSWGYFQNYEDSTDWQTCTQSQCPDLTNCIMSCDDDLCILDCVRVFKEKQVNCPCEVYGQISMQIYM